MDNQIPQQTEAMPCPYCSALIDSKDFFCPVCGKKVREKPVSTSIGRQLYIYAVSFLAPPFGLFWVMRYWRLSEKGRKIAIVIVAITIISLVVFTFATVGFINQVNSELNKQLNLINSNPYGM